MINDRARHKKNPLQIIGPGCLLLLLLFLPRSGLAAETSPTAVAFEKYPWTVTFYNGVRSDRDLGESIFNIPGSLEDNYLHGLGLARQIRRLPYHLSLEFEGIFIKHQGEHDQGYQDYEEYIPVFLLRYDHFPWNEQIHTSLAVGEGLSLTSQIPEREIQTHGHSQRLLNYLAFELALTAPAYPRYSLVSRIHHRSGVFGLFGGVKGASNFYVLGLRFRF
ncbi:MAG: hypothetical protein ACLFS7_07840 [Desulfosudaceae bacterium]